MPSRNCRRNDRALRAEDSSSCMAHNCANLRCEHVPGISASRCWQGTENLQCRLLHQVPIKMPAAQIRDAIGKLTWHFSFDQDYFDAKCGFNWSSAQTRTRLNTSVSDCFASNRITRKRSSLFPSFAAEFIKGTSKSRTCQTDRAVRDKYFTTIFLISEEIFQ